MPIPPNACSASGMENTLAEYASAAEKKIENAMKSGSFQKGAIMEILQKLATDSAQCAIAIFRRQMTSEMKSR